jgi:tetratricopeptide (TPR) repeat protein
MSDILKEMGRTQEADTLIVEVYQLQTQLIPPFSKVLKTLHEKMALFNCEKEQWSNAEWHCREVLKILAQGQGALEPFHHALAYIDLSRVVRLRDVREAVDCLLTAMAILMAAEPGKVHFILKELAELHEEKGMMVEARDYYEKWVSSAIQATSLGDKNSNDLINISKRLGNEYSEVRNYDRAIYYYDIAAVTIANRAQPDPRLGQVYLGKGKCYMQLGAVDKAREAIIAANRAMEWENLQGSETDEARDLLGRLELPVKEID